MSESESLELSAEDLMPAWVSGLEDVSPKPSAPKSGRDDNREDQRRGKGGGNRDGRKFDRGSGPRNDDRRQGARGNNDRGNNQRGSHHRQREDRQPVRAEDIVPQVDFVVEPTTEAVKALAKHIRSTNRAYAMAEVAQMVLAAGDRYRVIFRVKSDKQDAANKKPAQDRKPNPFRLVRCKIDDSVWLSREEAVAHFLNTPDLFNEYYEVEEVKTEAPKGNFSVIAVCGLSGTILGPPNHHEYQQNIAALHRERFGSMPLERFKSRIEMRRDEETIERWKEQMSSSKQYRVRTNDAKIADNQPKADENQVPVVEETSDIESDDEPQSAENISEEDSSPVEEAPNETTPDEPVLDSNTESAEPSESVTVTESPEDEQSEKPAVDKPEAEDSAPSENDELISAEEDPPIENIDDPQIDPSIPSSEESEPVITSMTELTRHFREHFARRIFKEVNEARLPGTVTKKLLSSSLTERMNAEINWQKRSFPLPMVRTLCRNFENQGLKFFKRGEKALFVSASRPRALANDTVLTDRLVQMLNHIKDKPGTLAADLIRHLNGESAPKKKAASEADNEAPKVPVEPSKNELAMLADLRWLLAEGYLIEFPSSELLHGTAVSVDKRKRRPAKRSKKKRPPAKKAAAETKNDDSQPKAASKSSATEPAASDPSS